MLSSRNIASDEIESLVLDEDDGPLPKALPPHGETIRLGEEKSAASCSVEPASGQQFARSTGVGRDILPVIVIGHGALVFELAAA